MNRKRITVIDYGCGNIFSLRRILEKLGYNVLVTNDPDLISNADKIIPSLVLKLDLFLLFL